jgi:uncharacterized protein with GYD domain
VAHAPAAALIVPLFLSRFTYEPRTWARLIHDHSNRRAVVEQTVEAAGGRLHEIWYTLGPQDGFVLFEAPDEIAATAFLSVSVARGNLRAIETTRLLTIEELGAALDKAQTLPLVPPSPDAVSA